MTLNELKNPQLKSWLQSWVDLCTPDAVRICDGSQEEYDELCDLMVKSGTFIKLNRPKNSYLCRSEVGDVARVEARTYICSKKQEDAGHTNNWCDPDEMRAKLKDLYKGCMKGRTLFVIPFSMGPVDSPISKYGIEITDSPYVVVNMHIMTRVSTKVIKKIDKGTEYVKCVHSVGAPLEADQADEPWPCAAMEKKHITHFPETREILSFGSGYGGNALLGKKCFALRIASVQARDEGWLAEHMLILKLTNPKGASKFVAAAFPSACGKTNLAMMKPTIKGWKVEVIGDDIAWMKFDKKGQLRAINPEAGFFGVAPGTSMKSNPNAMLTCNRGNAIFTNNAITMDGGVYWEDMDQVPEGAVDWKRRPWTPDMKDAAGKSVKAAHPNARFTVPARQCPVIAQEWEDPAGVPISAFLFGGRRASVVPLANEALDWEHGVFLGATMASEMTAAAVGGFGQLRFDPFAMLPFCGYNMGDYFAHWLKIGKVKGAKLPKIFYVNWFRKSPEGKWLWPGFGENSRVLKWIFERVDGTAAAEQTAIGNIPTEDAIDFKGLKMTDEEKRLLLAVDKEGWLKVIPEMREHFAKFGKNLPKEMDAQLEALAARLAK